MASITDVARLAGVSPATASRVMSAAPYAVADETRARVLAAARELDYVPNALARGLQKSTSPVVGVIVHDARQAAKVAAARSGKHEYEVFEDALRRHLGFAGAVERIWAGFSPNEAPNEEEAASIAAEELSAVRAARHRAGLADQ